MEGLLINLIFLMLKIFNYILIIFLFFFNIALAEKVKVFEFTENELSKLKVKKILKNN